jgi:hypothetical protein
VKNSVQLINELNNTSVNESTRMCSFDIKHMYTNFPQQGVTHIIHKISEHNGNISSGIQNMLNITVQNYFQSDSQYYIQNTGLAVGAPTSAVIAETYLQI